MSIKNIVAIISILSIIVITLIINPLFNQSVRAEQIYSTNNKHQIVSLQDAAELFKNYKHINTSKDIIAQYFGKELVDKILAQPGCAGVRLYYGRHANGKSGIIIIGVDKYGKDMISGVIAKPSVICPPYCGTLN